MRRGGGNILGLAFSDRAITCAEISSRGDLQSVRAAATFEFTEDLSIEKPDALGAALLNFLRERDFSASRAIVGVPARWIIAVEKEFPAASSEQVRGMLRLQAERLPLAESGELVFDATDTIASNQAGRVLLVAMLKKQLDRITQTLDAAQIEIVGVVPTMLAIAAAAEKSRGPMLMLGRHGAEILLREQNGLPTALRHVAVAGNGQGPAIAQLGAELRRSLVMSAAGESSMTLWDSIGLSESQVSDLSNRAGIPIRGGEGINRLPTGSSDQFISAIALATLGAQRTKLPIDLSNSRLAAPAVSRFGRRSVWASIIGAVVLFLFLMLFWDVRSNQNTLDDLNQQAKTIEPDVSAAKQAIDRTEYARGYFDARPPILDCLREISLAFGEDNSVWTTSFSMKDARIVQLGGRATDQSSVLALADRLRKNPRFTDVKLLDVSPGGGRLQETVFTITFTFGAAN